MHEEDDGTVILSEADILDTVEDQALARLGYGASEFHARWAEGELERADSADLVALLFLLPRDHPLCAALEDA